VAWDTPEDYPAQLEASPTENSPVQASLGVVHSREEIQRLKLAERMRLHTSYSQIYQQTSETMGMDGRLTRSEEPVVTESVLDRVRPDDWLPRGARTGDALHELLEKWLAPNADVTWLTEKDIPSIRISEAHQTLLLHGIEPVLAPKVTILLKRVLCSPLVLPNGKTITLGALPAQDRLPEVEFHWAFDPQGQDLEPDQNPKGWMVGYIDLLFRVDGTWYVLDWKTTSVLDWNPNALQQSMDEHGYSLQARIYGRTVARALPSNEQFGGSVYVYLRAFADEDTASQGVWCGGPDLDDGPVRQTLQKWIEQQTFPGESR
jgi:ATP-dependent exoDNAse (exonuclease V) beta subunit